MDKKITNLQIKLRDYKFGRAVEKEFFLRIEIPEIQTIKMLFPYDRFDNQPTVETVHYGANKHSLRLKLMEMNRRIFS